ncbi:MAG: PIN domain-containing protein [Thermodesulfobacteriota bacterium]|nr:MAG: PIN domain-containing protein [Thermodesulfobacteriota bacterium]
MRILIDTNIIIHLEDSSKILDDSLSELFRLAYENRHEIVIHPASFDDIKKDRNEKRKEISFSRVRKYPVLKGPPEPGDLELKSLGLSAITKNDHIDNLILYAVYKDAVNILVTEDREMHKKAAFLGLSDRVHYIQQAAEFLRRLYSSIPVSLPNIEEAALYQIDLRNSFFDSLREDYSKFDEWYKMASREGRKAWVHRNEKGELGAICIYKEEKDPIITTENISIPGRVLKLCTFKVEERMRGRKLGELLLKAAFRYATDNKIEHIYITMKPGKQNYLEDMCEEFGFYRFGKYIDNRDDVFIKEHFIMPPDTELTPLEYNVHYFPHFKSDKNVKKYIVPIRPKFHGILFPEIEPQPSLIVGSTAGNAIKQAYLCHARIHGISPGDILLFYRSQDLRAITSLGIVELSTDLQELEKIIQIVSKRTVYTFTDIKKMAEKKTKVILFRLSEHFSLPISYKWLITNEVVRGNIQTIRGISHESFTKIMQEFAPSSCIHAH